MARQIQILDQDSQENLLTLDAAVSYTISGDVEATDHPVEQGANITDHLRAKPRTIEVEGWISNTPLPSQLDFTPGFLADNQFPPDEPGPAEAAYFMLENRRLGGFLHTVVTKIDTFPNMALIRVSEPRSAGVGDALQFNLTFKEIRIVQNQAVTVPTKTASGQSLKKTGKKSPKKENPSQNDRSSLAKIDDATGKTASNTVRGFFQ